LSLKGTAIWKEINSFFRERGKKEKAELIEQNLKEKCQRERRKEMEKESYEEGGEREKKKEG